MHFFAHTVRTNFGRLALLATYKLYTKTHTGELISTSTCQSRQKSRAGAQEQARTASQRAAQLDHVRERDMAPSQSHQKVIVVASASAAAQAAGAPLSMQLSTLHTHSARAKAVS